MIDRADLLSLETSVRAHLGEETARFWTQTALHSHINDEAQRLARRAITMEQGYLERTYTATSLSSATVALPPNCFRIRNLEVYQDGLWQPLRWIGPESRYLYATATGTTTEALAVRLSDTDLIIENGLGTVTQLRIQYARIPAAMRYEAMSAGSTAGNATFTMQSTASPLDDIYNGDRILTVDGDGEGQYCVITDYVGSTKVATVTPVWATTVNDTTYYSTVLPSPLDQFSDLVALGAAMKAAMRRRDEKLIGQLSRQYALDFEDFENTLGKRQTDQAARVTYIPHHDLD